METTIAPSVNSGRVRKPLFFWNTGTDPFLLKWIGLIALTVSVLVMPSVLVAETVSLTPSKDNTLYENSSGSLSNGAGSFLFAGKVGATDNSRIRRTLLSFDLSGIPSGAVVTSVQLTLNMSKAPSASLQTVTLHSVLSDWGEGTSVGDRPQEGSGGPATAGDATWVHTFFNTGTWDRIGGDFSSASIASQSVGGNGKYTWGPASGMISDVQNWIDTPSSNFGWLLKGNESTSRTVKRFDSRQNTNALNRPALSISYELPSADLEVDKTVDKPAPRENDTITYSVTLSNNGPNDAASVQLMDELPSGVAFVSAEPGQGRSYSSTSGIWTVGSLANGSSATLTISGLVNTGTVGTTITNTASIADSDVGDPVAGNNSSSAGITVAAAPTADLSVGKTVNTPVPKESDTVSYTITVTNDGPDNATGVELTDQLPTGITYASHSTTQGTYTSTVGIWSVGTLADGGSATLTITATVDTGTTGTTIANTASVSGSDLADPISGNDSDSVNIVVALGDVDDSGTVDLADAIVVLQTLVVIDATALVIPDYATSGVDVDGDGNLGLAEAVYALQKVAGIR